MPDIVTTLIEAARRQESLLQQMREAVLAGDREGTFLLAAELAGLSSPQNPPPSDPP